MHRPLCVYKHGGEAVCEALCKLYERVCVTKTMPAAGRVEQVPHHPPTQEGGPAEVHQLPRHSAAVRGLQDFCHVSAAPPIPAVCVFRLSLL